MISRGKTFHVEILTKSKSNEVVRNHKQRFDFAVDFFKQELIIIKESKIR